MRRPRSSPVFGSIGSMDKTLPAWRVAVRCAVFACVLASPVSLAQDPATLAGKGEASYSNYCSTCHGDGLRNPGGGPTFDLRRLKSDDYSRFVKSVLDGKNTMPPWRGVLDIEEVNAIWAYIRATVDQ
jgi:mono/diheme cytochrome c family protein